MTRYEFCNCKGHTRAVVIDCWSSGKSARKMRPIITEEQIREMVDDLEGMMELKRGNCPWCGTPLDKKE